MSRRRPPRGRPRPAPRRPAYDDYDEYDDDYDDRGSYAARSGGSNIVPWLLVSLFVVGAFVILVMVASSDDEEDTGMTASGQPKVYDLSYKPFEQEYTFLLRHTFETRGPDDYDSWMRESQGRMRVTYGGGSGTISPQVTKFVVMDGKRGGGAQDRDPGESPLAGRTFSFTLGPQGGARMNDPSPDTAVMRTAICYMFPDLPSNSIDYDRFDRFSFGNKIEMVSKLPFLDGSRLDIPKYKMDVTPSKPGNLSGWGSGVTALEWVSTPGSYAGEANEVRHLGGSHKAYFSGTATGKVVLDYRTGMPVQVTYQEGGYVTVAPRDKENEWKYNFGYVIQINPIPR